MKSTMGIAMRTMGIAMRTKLKWVVASVAAHHKEFWNDFLLDKWKWKRWDDKTGVFWNELSPRIENATNDEEFCNWSSPASSAMMNEQRSYERKRNLKWFEGVFAKFLHTIQTPPSREFSNEFSPRDEGCDDRRTVDEDWKKIEEKWNFAKVHKMQISGGVLDARRTPWWLIITRWRNLGKLAIWSDVT